MFANYQLLSEKVILRLNLRVYYQCYATSIPNRVGKEKQRVVSDVL